MNEKLLPCPCCGGEAEFGKITDQASANFGGEFINCTRCPITTDLRFSLGEDCKETLAEEWNRRAAPSPVVAVPDVMEIPTHQPEITSIGDGIQRGFADGWNACRSAMLAASPRQEGA